MLSWLIRFRNTHPAFDGTAECAGRGSHLVMTWRSGNDLAELDADLASRAGTIRWTSHGHTHQMPVADLPDVVEQQ